MKKKKQSEEEFLKEKEEREIQDCRALHLSLPTIFYKVGDRVELGNITETHILKVMDDGMFYKVHCKHITIRYGKEVISENDRYVAWMDLLPYRTLKDKTSMKELADKDDQRMQYMQQDIMGLFTKAYHFGINFDPYYQRPLVWTLEDKQYLIESIFNNVDIGKFCFIRKPFAYEADGSIRKLYEIIDGKQRMNALMEFYEGRFKFKGLYYRDMHVFDQNHFEHYPVSVCECGELSEAQILKYFLKLNVSGKPQDPSHLEYVHSLYKNCRK